jgi:hypothetical protein
VDEGSDGDLDSGNIERGARKDQRAKECFDI